VYERYGPGDEPLPADPDAPGTSPDPEGTRVRPTTKCLVVRDGRACCIRFAATRDPDDERDGNGDGEPTGAGDWSLPGGGVEPDESVYAAAEREVREEVGLDTRAVAVLDVYSYFLSTEFGVERNLAVVVRCEERERRAVDTDTNPAAVEEIATHEWVPLDEVGDRVVGDALGEVIARRADGD
jgi:8-oxo-dGTP pyrophosphatase MutT (NUDIX family)